MPDLPNPETQNSSPTAASEPLQRQTPDALLLHGFWYRALPSDRVSRHKIQKTLLLGIPLAIGRDKSGHAFALRDSCPHRGIPLSDGKFDGGQIECCTTGGNLIATLGNARRSRR